MTVIARRVASTPERSVSATWTTIVDILAPDSASTARVELMRVAGVAHATITTEAPANDAFVVWGGGPRVRVYCAFGDDAITGNVVNEDAVRDLPTGSNWKLSIPCLEDDLSWMREQLKTLSSRVSVRAIGADESTDDTKKSSDVSSAFNMQEFLKP